MKLELKHLAPYLPYGLKVSWIREDDELIVNDLTMSDYPFLIKQYGLKPILRPLSDLNIFKPKQLSGRTPFEWSYYETEVHLINAIKTYKVNHNIWQFLVEHHFDVFGLIEKGLGIDINTK